LEELSMKIATWRFATLLSVLGLAACGSSPSKAEKPAPVAAQAAQPAQPAQAAKPAAPSVPAATASVAKAEVGKPAPDFKVKDLAGKTHELKDYRGKIVVLEWFSPACPYCVYAYEDGPLADQPERLAKEGVVWLSVNSQNPKHPGSKIDKNQAFVEKYALEAPLLMDPEGIVGRAYGAKTTPHCFVIDEKGVLVYAGALDNAPNGKIEGDAAEVNYVDAAIADLRARRPVATNSTRAYG